MCDDSMTSLERFYTALRVTYLYANRNPNFHVSSVGLEVAGMYNTNCDRCSQRMDRRLAAIQRGSLQGLMNLLSLELANLYTQFSPFKDPKEWLNLNKVQLNFVLRAVAKITENRVVEYVEFAKTMMYQRLISYTFTYIAICPIPDNHLLLNHFRENLTIWNSWDSVTALENHQAMKDYILNLFREHLQNVPEAQLKQLLAISDMEVCTFLAVVLMDNDTYKELLARRGPAAQVLLNLLHKRLSFDVHPSHKSRHVKALVRLSRASGLYPECMVLKDVEVIGDAIAAGSFGDVYKGLMKGQDIAVKALRIYQKSDMIKLLKRFSSEAVIWGQLNHPNVLPFYGIYHSDQTATRLCLVCPWMEYGDAVHYLRDIAPDTNCNFLTLDIAQGLEYLHNEHIVHGDLKALNILISMSKRACITDFGISIAIESQGLTYMATNKSGGTLRWQAPELLNAETGPTPASDIYAFAFVCYELYSNHIPFFELKDVRVMAKVLGGERPKCPYNNLARTRGLNDTIWAIIQECWVQRPTQRPSAAQVVGRLLTLRNGATDRRQRDHFVSVVPATSQDLDLSNPFSCIDLYTNHVYPLLVKRPI